MFLSCCADCSDLLEPNTIVKKTKPWWLIGTLYMTSVTSASQPHLQMTQPTGCVTVYRMCVVGEGRLSHPCEARGCCHGHTTGKDLLREHDQSVTVNMLCQILL